MINADTRDKLNQSAKIRTLRYRVSDRIAGEENINSSIVDDILYEFQTELLSILQLENEWIDVKDLILTDEQIDIECSKQYEQYSSQVKKSHWKQGVKWMRDRIKKHLQPLPQAPKGDVK